MPPPSPQHSATCSCCGALLHDEDRHIRFTLPDPALVLGPWSDAADWWISHADASSSVLMQGPGIGPFLRVPSGAMVRATARADRSVAGRRPMDGDADSARTRAVMDGRIRRAPTGCRRGWPLRQGDPSRALPRAAALNGVDRPNWSRCSGARMSLARRGGGVVGGVASNLPTLHDVTGCKAHESEGRLSQCPPDISGDEDEDEARHRKGGAVGDEEVAGAKPTSRVVHPIHPSELVEAPETPSRGAYRVWRTLRFAAGGDR